MAKFTLLEIHLEESTLTANAPYSGREGEETRDDAAATTEGSGRSAVGAAVLALVVLGVAAVGLRRLIGGSDSEELAPLASAGGD